MAITVKLRHLNIAPRKARLVADLIREKKIEEAQEQLKFSTKRAARPFLKLLNSAVATAEHDFDLEKSSLYICEVKVDEGPTLKRVRARAQGAFYSIDKRTSHLVLSLDSKEEKIVKAKKKEGPETISKDEIDEEELKEKREKELKKAKKDPNMRPERRKKKQVFRRKSI